MRYQLQPFLGCKQLFTARIARFGLRHQVYRGAEPTLMLKDLVLYIGSAEIPVDHVWVSTGKKLARLNPRIGDRLQFYARIRTYHKYLHATGRENTDYCIAMLSSIERLEAGQGEDFATYWGRLKASRKFITDKIEVPEVLKCTA